MAVTRMEMHRILQKDAEIWDLFTRREEYNPPIRDRYNRFPYYASRDRNIFKPRASEFLLKHGYHVEYPEGKPFAVCLTHDIDVVYESAADKGFTAIKQAVRGKSPGYSINQIFTRKYPYTNFNDIMELEERYNARSSFYFLALEPGDQDYSYEISDLEHELGIIKDAGCEVGLHVGLEGSVDLQKLLQEKRKLENTTGTSVTGCRNHYLRFVVPDSWELLQKAGFLYDCTLGYADCAGFRNGMCHPFRPYDLNSEKILDIIEIPQILMDRTISFDYMCLDSDRAWEVTCRLIDTVEACHGVITLLWHNSSLVGEQKAFYEKLLDYCAKKNAWMTSGQEIASWWCKQ
jgi:peptidoglycan/xylan/chitin deacetylase (PgdA/CDA1 family)